LAQQMPRGQRYACARKTPEIHSTAPQP
jgi:hypothetical protein